MSVMDAEHHLHEGDRVRIRNEVDPALYRGMSTIFNEGVIRKVREDQFGLPQVYIEWDKNHWSYNGAPDGWTFEEHFDVVESKSMAKQSKAELAEQFAAFLKMMEAEEEAVPEPPKPVKKGASTSDLRKRLEALMPSADDTDSVNETIEVEDATEGRAEAVKAVHEVLDSAEAFIVIAIQRVAHPKAENGMMLPFALTYADNPVAELLATAHMSGLSTQAYQELVLKAIGAAVGDDE
jgi:hypothetical protein